MKSEKIYEKGLIKVVWIENDPKKIYSKMFNKEEDAENFAKEKRDYITFRLLKQDSMEEFSWEMLPYGQHKLYSLLISNYLKHKGKILHLPLKAIENLLDRVLGNK